MNFKKYSSLMLFVFLLSVSSIIAQDKQSPLFREKKYNIELAPSSSILTRSIKIEKFIDRNDNKVPEKFQLSILFPFEFESIIPKTKFYLTAYKMDGSIFGMQTWNAPQKIEFPDNQVNIPVKLELNSSLVKANNFLLDIRDNAKASSEACLSESDPGGTTCSDCVKLATSACGADNIAGVTCGGTNNPDGCAFTCK